MLGQRGRLTAASDCSLPLRTAYGMIAATD
jgi:hypothetical protein